MKNIVIINSTYRKGGNSEALAAQFAKGATESGNRVQTIDLRTLEPKFCVGCLSCLKTGKCIHSDGVNGILSMIREADVLVFATPVYFYCMSGQLKTFLDRLNPLYGQENKFKDVYLLATSADTEERAMEGTVKGVQGWIECFEGAELKGVVYGLGADALGTVQKTPAFMQAYELGRSVR